MKKIAVVILSLFVINSLHAQKIAYSQPERDDVRSTDFEIIGKMNGLFLVYKNYRNSPNVCLYDNDMKLVNKEPLVFMPDRIINTDILAYKDYFYIFYQYQRRSIVYCMGAKMDMNGKIVGEPLQMDTTNVNFAANNKIYTVLHSEDKQRVAIVKINSRNEKNYLVTVSLFNLQMKMTDKKRLSIPMPERSDFLSEFSVDNDGDVVFVRAAGTSQNDNINKVTLITTKAGEDTVAMHDLDVSEIYLDDIKIKVDNINKHYLVTSFFSKTRKGNIDGLYCMIWDKKNAVPAALTNTIFNDQLRKEAKEDGNSKYAFNDYFLQDILVRKDGGYVIASESVYSSSRGNTLNRWDYLYGSPFGYGSNYYMWNSPYGYSYPWYRGNSFGNQGIRYFADNIALLSFDSTGKMEWGNVIKKSQYDDATDNYIGYGTMNTGDEVHFFYNQLERRNLLLTDQSITADGQVHRSPTFHNLDKGYQFMPRYAKQVSGNQIIVPCEYRNYICFAKIDF